MNSIAILASRDMMPAAGEALRSDFFELEEQMAKLTPAFERLGYTLELCLWNDFAVYAARYAAVLPLFVWDYFDGDNPRLFLKQITAAAKQTCLLNPLSVIGYNGDKRYLDELQSHGAPVIPSVTLDTVTRDAALAAAKQFGADTLVIKPQIGAGAWRQALWPIEAPFPAAHDLPPGRAILQPFLPSVQDEGEYSFLYFEGEFSHAVNKRPKDGDYRIQSSYGGTERPYAPSEVELNIAQEVLSYLPERPVYARVDLLRGLDGELKLIELEMIEPYLYLAFANGEGGDNEGAKRLARAVKTRLDVVASCA